MPRPPADGHESGSVGLYGGVVAVPKRPSCLASTRAYGDRVVAHFDRRAAVTTLTFKELGDTIEDLARLWTRYEHLLTGSFTSFEHFTITSDWQEPLRDSLFPISDIDEWFYRQYLNESYS
jgi:hypothetical protein